MLPSQIDTVQNYPYIKNLYSKTLDLFISDLRSMLQLPMKMTQSQDLPVNYSSIDLEGGCNYTSCITILDILCGLSVISYFWNNDIGLNTKGDRGTRFRDLLNNYYPWEFESLPSNEVSNILWQFLRNPLVHTLGLMPLQGVKGSINRVQINKGPIDKQGILELENISRPQYLSSTFESVNSTFHVNIPPFYWGLHQLFHKLSSDPQQMSLVDTWYKSYIEDF